MAAIDELSDVQLGYIAGLIDGEGCIRIQHSRKNGRDCYFPVVDITNTDGRIIEAVVSWTEMGRVRNYCYDKLKRWKRSWRWSVWRRDDVVALLTKVTPYLISKRERASIVLGFSVIKARKEGDDLEFYFLRMKELNKRGGG